MVGSNLIEIDLRSDTNAVHTVYVDVYDNSLSRKWLAALEQLLINNYHLEKNYCWLGFANSIRNPQYLCEQINRSIDSINAADLGYTINDWFGPANTIAQDGGIEHAHMNDLHRYFEDLQGVSGAMSPYYNKADAETRWHIRQLNLLCHEYESLILSIRKAKTAPDWQRPSQLMCWLNSPRFTLDEEDFDLFGINTINRDLGGVYVGVNKAVGKHHWEVFNDEGRDSRVTELTTSTLRGQTEAAGDFDIEWGQNPAEHDWQQSKLRDFRSWLITNGFDPDDKTLTIGHPKVAQVDLRRSFGTICHAEIWACLNNYLDVVSIRTPSARADYQYRWSDPDFETLQINIIKG